MMTAMKYNVWAIDAGLGRRVFFYGNDQHAMELLVQSMMRDPSYSEIELRECDTGKPVTWRDRVTERSAK